MKGYPKGMKEQPVKWFPNSAQRFIELLKHHTWNTAVKLLKRELAKEKKSA